MNFIKTGLIFTTEAFIVRKKTCRPRRLGTSLFDIKAFGIDKASFRLFVIR